MRTYYARKSRRPSRGAVEDSKLVNQVYATRDGYRWVYGEQQQNSGCQIKERDSSEPGLLRNLRETQRTFIRLGSTADTIYSAGVERGRGLRGRPLPLWPPAE